MTDTQQTKTHNHSWIALAFIFWWSSFGFWHQAITYFHWLQFSDPILLVLGGLTMVTAAWSMCNPRQNRRFVVYLCSWLLNKIYLAPQLPNHIFFSGLVALTILVVLFTAWLRRDPKTPLFERAFVRYAPFLRWELIILYFFVSLHKINTDYFNPDVSCGWQLYIQINNRMPWLPIADWMAYPSLVGALMFEMLIPMLLLFRRTAAWGLVVGYAFHLMLALHPNEFISSFTILMGALYILFAHPDAVANLTRQSFSHGPLHWLSASSWRMPALLTGFWAAIALTTLGRAAMDQGLSRNHVIDQLHSTAPTFLLIASWTVMLILAMYLIRCALNMTNRSWLQPRLAIGLSPAVVVLLLVIFNGFTPYLGLKNKNSFAMFSNLRTENGATNHLFMPVRFRLADYADDVAYVHEATDDHLLEVARQNMFYPWIELRCRVYHALAVLPEDERRQFTVTYQRGDGQPVTATFGQNPEDPLFDPPTFLERKLILFRPNPGEDLPMPCAH